MLSLDSLRVSFACTQELFGDEFVIRKIVVGVNMFDFNVQGNQQRKKFFQHLVFP